MATIHLHNSSENTATLISNIFIDNYMPNANGEYVKVYLYLLRCLGNQSQECSISTIADCFDHTEKDIIRALKYWEKVHLLQLEFAADKSIRSIRLLDISQAVQTPKESKKSQKSLPENAPADTARESQPKKAQVLPVLTADPPVVSVPAKHEYTLDEMKAFQQDPAVTELFFIIETYLKHPLSASDTNSVLYWYDELHFSADLIIYLVEYCICKGHSSLRYMEKVAIAWHENQISTVAEAKENAAMHNQIYYAVMKAFGITGRNLIDSETAYIDKWTKQYLFDKEIIQEACRRTITAIHQPSFEYADKILESWHRQKVHTQNDIQKLDETHSRSKKAQLAAAPTNKTSAKPAGSNKFNNFDQREYDFDQLEKILLTTSLQEETVKN